jgi:PBP1b-binding outer membrane lipoprotein LpoB
MKKILMLVPLLVFLAGCSKSEDMSSPPASTNAAATNAPAK